MLRSLRRRHRLVVAALRLNGSDCRIAHTVASSLQVASEPMLKTRIRMSRNLEVIPAMGSVQSKEFTQLSVWWQSECYRFSSVIVEDAYFQLYSGTIVNPKDYAITSDIIHDVGRNICLSRGNASLEHAKKCVRSKDGKMIVGLAARR